jgi:hypothetical protein
LGTFRRPADPRESLGTVEEVQSLLRQAIPKIQFFRDASGSDKIRAMEAQGIDIPQVIRDALLITGGSYLGLFEGEDWSFKFSLGQNATSVSRVSIDMRGSGNPMPTIERLMAIPNWRLTDVNGTTPTRESWSPSARGATTQSTNWWKRVESQTTKINSRPLSVSDIITIDATP